MLNLAVIRGAYCFRVILLAATSVFEAYVTIRHVHLVFVKNLDTLARFFRNEIDGVLPSSL